MAPPRAVNAGGAQNDTWKVFAAGGFQQQLFSGYQYLAQLASGFGRAAFLDHRAIGLAINAGAADMDQFLGRRRFQPLQDVAHALKVDLPVIIPPAFVGRNSIDDPIERRRQAVKVGPAGDIGGQRFDAALLQGCGGAARSSEAKDLVAQPRQFRPERKPDVATTDNQYSHSAD